MANKNIQESQQQSQNVTIGTQGNEDMTTPMSTEVSNKKENNSERQIPNQERSSASNADDQQSGRE